MLTRRSSGGLGPNLQFAGSGEPPQGPWSQPPPGPGPMAPPPDAGFYPPPPQAKKGFPWGAVLIGCGIFVVIIMVIGGACIYTAARKAGDLADLAKSNYVNQLTPDHTPEQKERFEKLLNAVWTDERKRLGFIKWSTEYQAVINQLTMISADSKITAEESTDWCDQAFNALEKNGYWGKDSEK